MPNGACERNRFGIVAVVGAILLAGCTGNPDDPAAGSDTTAAGEPGAEVIEAFAAAWPGAKADDLRGLVDRPEAVADDIASRAADLGILTTEVTTSGQPECDDDSCRDSARVTHQLAGAGNWGYETQITSRLSQGQWQVIPT